MRSPSPLRPLCSTPGDDVDRRVHRGWRNRVAVDAAPRSAKLDFPRSLGAEHVIDYAREDFTRTGRQYDLILDLVAHRSALDYARALAPGGTYFAVGGSVATFLQILADGPWLRLTNNKRVRVLMVRRNRKDLEHVAELCRSGQLVTAIDRVYPLAEVPEALRRLGEGSARGKLVIQVT